MISNQRKKDPIFRTVVVVVLILLLAACSSQEGESRQVTAPASTMMPGHKMGDSNMISAVKTPKVPFKYEAGNKKFQKMCASCHGQWGGGSEQGPPLMHLFYVPSHHSDAAFYNAVLKGVKQHHWTFGDMPPVAGTTSRDVEKIIAFVRWLQRENGIR
ncbi:MAG: cytochrome c [Candidatus Polarisedimenticolaceae bacterium]|nr:cytochrome c [Candidatus Polarisedimenticolaceae bacterium]